MTKGEKVILGIVGVVVGLVVLLNLLFFFVGAYLALKDLMGP